MDYVAEFYKAYFRDLIKDIAEKYLNNQEETLESEMDFIRESLKKEGLYGLFEDSLTRRNYNIWRYGDPARLKEREEEKESPIGRIYKYVGEADFSDIRKSPRNRKDIVWILQGSQFRYPIKNADYINGIPRDSDSYRQFQQLLEQLGFTEREKQIFNYNDAYYYFNALTDNGDYIYSQEDEDDDIVFLNSLQKSDLDAMHEKLLRVLKLLCYEEKDSKSVREMDVLEVIKVAEYLSDLIPIIDRNSKLKDGKRLLDERIEVRSAILKRFLFRKNNKEISSDELKKVLVKYFEDRVLISTLVEEMINKEKFTDEQILIMTEEYLNEKVF